MNSLVVLKDEGWDSGFITLVGARANSFYRSGSCAVGREVRIALFGGEKGLGRVLEVSADRVVVEVTSRVPSLLLRPIDLIVGLSRPQTTKKVIQAGVMSGVRSIHLVHLESGERSYLDSHILKEPHLSDEVIKSLEQVWEGHYPKIQVHRNFSRMIKDNPELFADREGTLRVVAEPGGELLSTERCAKSSSAVIAVGSEGGWSAGELSELSGLGFLQVGLGLRVVRVEVALLYLLGVGLALEFDSPF